MNQTEFRTLSIDDIQPFAGNPFQTRDTVEQALLQESISSFGIYSPVLVHPIDNGCYELISGHRRLEAAKASGLTEIPAVVRQMSHDEAVIALVDSNIHREHVLPSERAKAYQMKLEALRHQGKNLDDIGGHVGHRPSGMKSRDVIAQTAPDSARQIQRYIRLNHLEKPLLDMVDAGRIALTPAVQLSYLKPKEQAILADEICAMDATPNLSQSMRLRKISETTGLTTIQTRLIMAEAKANQREYLRLPMADIRRFFPREFTDRQISEAIIKALESTAQQRKRSLPSL